MIVESAPRRCDGECRCLLFRHLWVCAVMFLRVAIVCWCEVGGIFWVVHGEGCIIVSCRVCVVV